MFCVLCTAVFTVIRHFAIYGFSMKMLPHLTFGLSLHFDELFVSEMAMIRCGYTREGVWNASKLNACVRHFERGPTAFEPSAVYIRGRPSACPASTKSRWP